MSDMPTTRIAVLGTGAIGGVIGAFLSRHALSQRQATPSDASATLIVTLVARGTQVDPHASRRCL